MRRHHLLRVVLLLVANLPGTACRRGRPAWVLLHPPEVRDDAYPRGHRLLTAAPLGAWRRVAAFGTEASCQAARQRHLDEAIDRARAEHGDDAKYELPVRRAVNARCVAPGRP